MKVNELIIEYILTCDKRGEVLNFADFIPLWCASDQRAEERADDEAKAGQLLRRSVAIQ